MTTPPSPSRPPWWSQAYRAALAAFPRDFRDRWGREMHISFIDRVHARRARRGWAFGLVARELANVLLTGVHERIHTSRRRFDMIRGQDIRYAFRLLGRSPGFTLLTVLVLAGGLGVSTFTFSFLHTAIVRPLPLPEGGRIARLTQREDGRWRPIDAVDLTMLRASMSTMRDLGGYDQREVMLGRAGEGRAASATVADPVLFTVARTPALLGRTLLPSDAEPGAEPVVVLSHRLWESAFAGSRSVLDSRILVNGVNTRVVGVMPEAFGFPVVQDAWLPMPARAAAAVRPGTDFVSVFGRLAPGANREQAASEATALLERALAARDSSRSRIEHSAIVVESFPAAQIGDDATLIFTSLNVAAALILLLALINVTTLLTARANERVRETAVRLALGATTGRLVMQGMWEGIVLCLAGGIVGTAGAAWGLETVTRWTRANMPDNLAFWWVWRLDRVTLLSAGAFITVAIAVLGAVVALRAARTNVRAVMQDGGARAGSRREGRVARTLIAMQVAAVTILMFVGVLSGVVAHRVVTIDPGYDVATLLQVTLAPSEERFPTDDARASVFRTAAARLSERAELDGALLRARVAARGERGRFQLRDAPPSRDLPTAHIFATLGDLSTLGIHVIGGRVLEASDDRTRMPVALVSRSLATRLWPGESPIGHQLRLAAAGDTTQWRTVVGVASDLLYGNPLARDRSPDAVYLPLLQAAVPDADVIVRYRSDETAGRQALYDVFGAIDPLRLPDYVYRTSDVLRKSAMIATGTTKLFGGCFVFALLLAVTGTYGLMSRSIGLRTREIGVRRALGASDGLTTRMLLTQGARHLGVGTLAAAPVLALIAAAATHYFPLSGTLTATTGLLVSVAITTVVLAATWVPTRRALRVSLRDALWRE